MVPTKWVDIELIDNIKERSRLSRKWRIARKEGKPQELLTLYEREYKDQQVKILIMSGTKKGAWEKRKIIETKKDEKKILEYDKGTLR